MFHEKNIYTSFREVLSLSLSLVFLLGGSTFSSAQTTKLSEPLNSLSILSGASATSVQTTDVKGAVAAIGTVDTTIKSTDTTLQGAVCVTQRALDSLTSARSKLAAAQPAQSFSVTALGSTTLNSGTRNFSSSVTLSDAITLTGDSTSKFIFNISGSLTFAPNTQIILSGGVKAENVFFNVSSGVLVGDSVTVCGTILAGGTITCSQNISASGARLLSADSVNLVSSRDTLGIISQQLLLTPTADAGRDTIIFAGQSVQIGAAPVAGNTYSWATAAGLSNVSIANPIANQTVTTVYILTVTNTNGCTATDTVIVHVLDIEDATRMHNTFIRNDGQEHDELGNPVPVIKYSTFLNGLQVYFTANSIQYIFPRYVQEMGNDAVDSLQFVVDSLYRMDLEFIGSNPSVQITSVDNLPGYNNFYYAHASQGILNVTEFRKIIYENLYNNIDLSIYYTNNGLKYDFYVKPGGNPSDIRYKYIGYTSLNLNSDGNITVIVPYGRLIDTRPLCYQRNLNLVKASFAINGQEISFNVGNYNSNDTLIIDPVILWATYYGGIGYDGGSDITSDIFGNIFITGYTSSTSNFFPTYSNGVGYYQGTFGGGLIDAFVLKFNNTGVRQWATYFGGTSSDIGNSITTDLFGNVFLVGETSSPNFPQFPSTGYTQSFTSGEAFITKFNNLGTILWSTFYGGPGFDAAYSVTTDNTGNIYVTGNTASSNFPLFNPGGGAYFSSTRSGPSDIFVLKFNNTGTRLWATLYGGNTGEAGYGIGVDNTNNLFITGYTNSTNFPTVNPGGGAYFQTTSGGSHDGFMLKFNNNFGIVWATYYGGGNYDQGDDLVIDNSGNVFVEGWTNSTNLPTLNPGGGAYFQGSFAGGANGDMFITKFNNMGGQIWSTYYGGNNDDLHYKAGGIAINRNTGDLLITGFTKSTNFPILAATNTICPNMFQQNSLIGWSDAFILLFNNNGVRKWATYLGGNDGGAGDWGSGIVADANGNIFITGEFNRCNTCPSSTGVPTVNPGGGAYYQSTNSYLDDIAIVKVGGVTSVSVSPNPASFCPGSSVQLNVSPTGLTYSWSPNLGLSCNNCPNPVLTLNTSGTYVYFVTVTDANVCTSVVVVNINVIQPASSFTFNQYDNCEDNPVQFTSTSTGVTSYSWNFGDPTSGVNNTSNIANPTHTFIYPGYYRISLTATNQCGINTSFQIIYIIPSVLSPPYNPNCCIASHTYVNNVPFHTPNSINITITLGQSPKANPLHWTTSMGIIQIKGTLTIKQEAGLVIDPGVVVGFGPQGRVIVEPGSELILDGATLTSVQCDFLPSRLMWRGVEVWGNKLNSSASAQGKIVMKNNAKIEDAHIGVMLGMSDLQYLPGNPNQGFQYNGHISVMGGGIIDAKNSTFNRNAQGVHFWEFSANNYSIISNCSFISKNFYGSNGSVFDPYYNGSFGPVNYNTGYLHDHNPFLGFNTIAFFGEPKGGIGMYGVKRVLLYDNYFEYLFVGINAMISKVNVIKGTGTGHSFKNILGFGIIYDNFNSPISANTVSDNTFIDVNTSIVFYSARYNNINNNKFNFFSGSQLINRYGADIINSSNTTIVDNDFNRLERGILFYSSAQTASSLIGFWSKGNTFTSCSTSVVTNDANNLLTIRCNTHINPSASDYIVNWNNTGTIGQQGIYAPPPVDILGLKEKKPAGNKFNEYPLSPSRRQIQTGTSYKYYAHSAPADRIPTGIGFVAGDINSGSVPSTSFLASCIPIINPTCIPCQRQAITNDSIIISSLQTEFNTVLANLDKGQTAQLLAAIINYSNSGGNASAGQLKNLLLQNSLLSDEVLLSFISNSGSNQTGNGSGNNNNVDIPPGIFKDVIIPNSPVSDKVLTSLNTKLNTLPPGIANQVRQAQTVNPGVRTLTAIAREIIEVEKDRQTMLNNVIAHYANADSLQIAIALLERETNIEAKKTLAATYIEEGNYAAALNKLVQLPTNTIEDAAFVNLHSMYIDLFSNDKTLWYMDSSQIELVRTIANLCPASLATTNARAVLKLVFGETVPDCPNTGRFNQSESNLSIQSKPDLLSRPFLGDNIPNPFSALTVIPYYLPVRQDGRTPSFSGEEIKNPMLQIRDMAGRQIKSIPLQPLVDKVELSMQDFENGIYFYSMIVDGQTIQTKKMIVIK